MNEPPVNAPQRRKRGGWSTKSRPPEERFWEKVDVADCWEFTGAATPTGYGTFFPTRSTPVRAYRYAWELLVGPIPPGMTIDHLCNNPRCVNPDHMRIATQRENCMRGNSPIAKNARKTHCKHGHALIGANVRRTKHGGRECIPCAKRRAAEKNARLKAERRTAR